MKNSIRMTDKSKESSEKNLWNDYIKLAKRWRQDIKKNFAEEVLELIESYEPDSKSLSDIREKIEARLRVLFHLRVFASRVSERVVGSFGVLK